MKCKGETKGNVRRNKGKHWRQRGGIIEGEVVKEMRKNEGQGAQDRNNTPFL